MGFQELCLLCYETQRLRHSQVGCVAQSLGHFLFIQRNLSVKTLDSDGVVPPSNHQIFDFDIGFDTECARIRALIAGGSLLD